MDKDMISKEDAIKIIIDFQETSPFIMYTDDLEVVKKKIRDFKEKAK